MRDPHVEAVYFNVGSAEDISYQNPEPLVFSHPLGKFTLADGVLKVLPAEHFGSGHEASQALEGFLRAWEIEADLKQHLGMIRFSYSHAEVIDRNPLPQGVQHVQAAGIASGLAVSDFVTCHITAGRYPSPPVCFSATEYAQYAHRRWLGYKRGQEPLLATAYFILTLLERQAGSRAQACILFKIDRDVLDRLGSWCSERGGPLSARKAKSTDFEELTHIETDWLDRAVKRLILRLGEYASGQSLEQLTLESMVQS
ncbi:hypothetical protein [Pseudomonas panipatensis]|uniref:hypothetical protein n=1 Tax=Pseudomonas panipatensis TaxID=428992 RepID=UPI0035B4791A